MKHPHRDRAPAANPAGASPIRLFALAVLCVLTAAATTVAASPAALAPPGPADLPGAAPYRFETTPGVLSRQVLPERSKLFLELDPYADRFSGSVTHVLRVEKPTAKIVLHAADLDIGAARLAGSDAAIALNLNKAEQTLTLELPQALPAGRHEISLDFSGKLTANGYGLYYSSYRLPGGEQKRMLATQLESIGAREMLPCFDEPAFRPVWEVTVSAPEQYTAVSNMPVVRQSSAGGKRRTEFAPTPGMSSYLLAIAVGELVKTSDRFEDTDLAIYSVAGKPQHAAFALDASKRLLAFYKSYFGSAYPLPKLDQIAVPGMRGAMENWGLITYSEDLLIVNPESASYRQRYSAFNVIAHEISHQWFGNLVTMAWWDGLWLNESFASWMAHKATAALNPQWSLTAERARVKEQAMAIDVLSGTPPIERRVERDQSADELFDAISYQKGQSVLQMIERFAGETAWRDGLRDYLGRHAYSNATRADLWAAISRSTAGDVPAFANTWTRQPGFPLVNAELRCGKDGSQRLQLSQTRFVLKPGQLPPAQWQIALAISQPGRTAEPERVLLTGSRMTEVAAGRCGTALLLDAGGGGYFRVRYDRAMQALLDGQRASLDTADRMRMIDDAWALAEAGLESPQRAYDLIAALRGDDPPELWQSAITVYRRAQSLLRDGPLLAASCRHARSSLGRAFEAQGWAARPGESDAARDLRADLIAALASCDDGAVQGEARRRWNALLANPAGGSDGDLLSGVIRALGATASVADVEALAALVEGGRNPGLDAAVLAAFGAVRDPDAARAVLQLSLTDRLPRSMSQWLISEVARSGRHDALAWQFMRDNLPALYARNAVYSRRFLLAAPLSGSRDTGIAKAVEALAATELEADARSEVRRGIARVERNALAYAAIRHQLGFLRVASGQKQRR